MATGNLIRGVLVPSLAAVSAFAVLVCLGLWQVDRKTWKEGLIAALEERLSAAPVVLPPSAEWPRLNAEQDEFLRIALTAEFLNDREALVYTSGSTLREASGGPGYWVFTPARLPAGALVMVNRGFVPDGKQDVAARPQGQVTGPVAMIGVLRWPEKPGLFTPAGDPVHKTWFARDSTAMAAAMGIGVAPFYVELESPEPPGGLPHAGRLRPNLPNNHLSYALTWFGLAAVLVGVYATWLFGNWRGRDGVVESGGAAAHQ